MIKNIIFVHGMESSGQGFKGRLLRNIFPNIKTPSFFPYTPNTSFQELLKKRMDQLVPILQEKTSWAIIGSSFGGLMASLYAFRYPENVDRLVLLAPFLDDKNLDPRDHKPIDVPVIVFHGKNDAVVNLDITRRRANELFKNLIYNEVEDDHFLHPTVSRLDWYKVVYDDFHALMALYIL